MSEPKLQWNYRDQPAMGVVDEGPMQGDLLGLRVDAEGFPSISPTLLQRLDRLENLLVTILGIVSPENPDAHD